MKLLDRFRQFMIGRYGSDQLNMALIVTYFIISLLASWFRFYPLVIVGYLLVFYCFYRMFSKNCAKRYQENAKFLYYWNPVVAKGRAMVRRMKERKTHRFYRCKSCGQMIRVPKGKGKICITCPKCKNEFIKKS